MSEVFMGTLPTEYNPGSVKDIMFSVTEECNLRCKYCYMLHKNHFHVMSFETAKKVVDYFLEQPPMSDYVIWEFIGGEPTLEMELIDKITDYIKIRQYVLNHPWQSHHKFFIGSNGTLYDSKPVQDYIKKNKNNLQIGITIDGTKEKHDLQRVKIDGSGSYDDVARNIPLWQSQMDALYTKVTFASEDLKYLKESIIHLWNMGIKQIAANTVFENVWKEGDAELFEKQLKELADYVLDGELWDEYSVRFFDPQVGYPLSVQRRKTNVCGTGRMVAVDTEGNFYPCVRFLDLCLDGASVKSACSGNYVSGIDEDKIRAFENLSVEVISDEECNECPIAQGCFSCAGYNYDDSSQKTIYHRAKYICEMQKALVRGNQYFWEGYTSKTGLVSPYQEARWQAFEESEWRMPGLRFLHILLRDDEVSFCNYTASGTRKMSEEIFHKALDYAHHHNMVPVLLGNPGEMMTSQENCRVNIKFLKATIDYTPISTVEKVVHIVSSLQDLEAEGSKAQSCILVVDQLGLSELQELLEKAREKYNRVNLYKQNYETWTEKDCQTYRSILEKEKKRTDTIRKNHMKAKIGSLNVQSNLGELEERLDCGAGDESFMVAPNGKIYICPAFYYDNEEDFICTIEEEIPFKTEALLLLKEEKSPVCSKCENYHCNRCVFDNQKKTGNINIPSYRQCELSRIERETAEKTI